MSGATPGPWPTYDALSQVPVANAAELAGPRWQAWLLASDHYPEKRRVFCDVDDSVLSRDSLPLSSEHSRVLNLTDVEATLKKALSNLARPTGRPDAAPVWVPPHDEGNEGGYCDRNHRRLTYKCTACDLIHWRPQPCDRRDCGPCYERVRRKKAKAAKEALGQAPVGTIVCTFPSEWRPYVTPRVLRAFTPVFREAGRAWFKTVMGVDMGGRGHWHPCGDSPEPDEFGCSDSHEWAPHWNMVFPLLGPQRHHLLGPKLVRTAKHVPEEALDLLRAVYAVVLQEVFEFLKGEYPGEMDCLPPGYTANAHYNYRPTAEKVSHALDYFLRHFPGWDHVWGPDRDQLAVQRASGWAAGRIPTKHRLWAECVALARSFTTGHYAAEPVPCTRCEHPLPVDCMIWDADMWYPFTGTVLLARDRSQQEDANAPKSPT